MSESDRISYSYGMKVPGPVPYSSIDVHLSYSTDLLPGETPAVAMQRARTFVQAQVEKDYDEIRGSGEG